MTPAVDSVPEVVAPVAEAPSATGPVPLAELLAAPSDLAVWQVAALVGLALLVAVGVWLFHRGRVDPLLLAGHRAKIYERVKAAAEAAAKGPPSVESYTRANALLQTLRAEFGDLFTGFAGVGAFVSEMERAVSELPSEDRDAPTKVVKERQGDPPKQDPRKKPYQRAFDAAVAFRNYWIGSPDKGEEVRGKRLQDIKSAQYKLGLLTD